MSTEPLEPNTYVVTSVGVAETCRKYMDHYLNDYKRKDSANKASSVMRVEFHCLACLASTFSMLSFSVIHVGLRV
jgi:hypothetical protein